MQHRMTCEPFSIKYPCTLCVHFSHKTPAFWIIIIPEKNLNNRAQQSYILHTKGNASFPSWRDGFDSRYLLFLLPFGRLWWFSFLFSNIYQCSIDSNHLFFKIYIMPERINKFPSTNNASFLSGKYKNVVAATLLFPSKKL